MESEKFLYRSQRHPLLMSALLAALFVRSLVPDGFMPAEGEMVELCTLHGPRTVMTDPATGEILEIEDEQAMPPCPWWLALSSLAALELPALRILFAATLPPQAPQLTLPVYRASLALPPARAPPVVLST
ncbi:MAG: hypothetical protein ACNA8J_05040 [Gammaproteobacteria bacterium]